MARSSHDGFRKMGIYSTASGNNRAIWAYGLRNPFKLAVKPGTNTILVNDVGENAWEEVNRGALEANYG